MENQNKKTKKLIDRSESSNGFKAKAKEKSRLILSLDLLTIDLEISTIKREIELCNIDDMPDQRKILLDGYTLLLNKRNEIIKEL
jgi:hypothetical protein